MFCTLKAGAVLCISQNFLSNISQTAPNNSRIITLGRQGGFLNKYTISSNSIPFQQNGFNINGQDPNNFPAMNSGSSTTYICP